MTIRKTLPQDIETVMAMYDYARSFMRANGNPNQWIDGYPSVEQIMQDLEEGHSYVCEDEEGNLTGTFCFMEGPDPTYHVIYEGEWLNNEPYGVIHRITTNGKQKGVAATCLQWCYKRCSNVRVDTHRDNSVMQNILTKHGFSRCGIIHIRNGSERIAFQKVVEEKTGDKSIE